MDKKALLEQFEALPLMVAILNDSFIYVDQTSEYTHPNLEDNRVTLGYVNGAWYAFQHQQAKVEELQKRVDLALEMTKELRSLNNESLETYSESIEETICDIEQALKGGGTTNLNIDEKGECRHFSTTMFHEGKAECFHCDAVVNEDREVIGKQSKGFCWTAKERDQ